MTKDEELIRNLRMFANIPYAGTTCADLMVAAADEIERLRAEVEHHRRSHAAIFRALRPSDPDRTTWPAEIERLRAELKARTGSGSASDRLHNICRALEEEAASSVFSREEWDRIDAENVALVQENKRLRAALAESEQEPADLAAAELRNIADAKRFDKECFDDDRTFADWAQSRARFTLWKIESASSVRAEPLTDEELRECFTSTNTAEPLSEGWPGLERFARAVERKVRGKA